MATINTIQDLFALLDENPEWVEELRARILTPELLELPERMAEFAAGLEELRKTVEAFIESTNRRFDMIEARLGRVEGTLEEHGGMLKEHGGMLKEHGGMLKEHSRTLEDHGQMLKTLRRDVAVLRGGHARTSAIREATSIVRSMGFRPLRKLTADDLWDITDSANTSGIPEGQLDSFRKTDLVMEVTDAGGEAGFAAISISYTVHKEDIDTIIRNARFLTRFTGKPASPAVVGEYAAEDAKAAIDSGRVFWYELESEELEVE